MLLQKHFFVLILAYSPVVVQWIEYGFAVPTIVVRFHAIGQVKYGIDDGAKARCGGLRQVIL